MWRLKNSFRPTEHRTLLLCAWWCAALLLCLEGERCFGQSAPTAPTLLRADGTAPLHTQSVALPLAGATTASPLEFKFGFETDETFGPGEFFDAFTLTLRSEDGLSALVLLTADAGGVVFAPVTPGTIPLSESSLLRMPIAAPVLNPNLTHRFAFSVRATLPQPVLGQNATLYLDLFDNNNGVASQGWLSDLVVVPEPAGWSLLALAGLGMVFRRIRKS